MFSDFCLTVWEREFVGWREFIVTADDEDEIAVFEKVSNEFVGDASVGGGVGAMQLLVV